MELGLLDRAIREVGALDPEALADDELHELVVAEQALAAQFAAVRARHVAAWDARRVWHDDGSRSAASRMVRECGTSARSTRADLRRARKLRHAPLTAAALASGKLSVDGADLILSANQPEIAQLFARDEWLLVEKVTTLWFPHAVRAVRYWIQQAHEAAGVKPPSCRRDGRHFHAVRTFQDSIDLRGVLDPVEGSEFLAELRRLEDELFETDWKAAKDAHGRKVSVTDLTRTAEQRRADALVEMACRSRTMPTHGIPPRPLLTVLCGYEAFNRVCELSTGVVLSPEQVVPLLGRADIERIVFDGPSRVIDVGVRRRFFEDALRRAIEVRDRHCQHPSGCDVPAERCQVDHIVPYTRGGLTTQENGQLECPAHNRAKGNRIERHTVEYDDSG